MRSSDSHRNLFQRVLNVSVGKYTLKEVIDPKIIKLIGNGTVMEAANLTQEILTTLNTQGKIAAIKLVRERRSLDLKAAKELVEAFEDKGYTYNEEPVNTSLPKQNIITTTVTRSRPKNGLVLLFILAVLGYFLFTSLIQQ